MTQLLDIIHKLLCICPINAMDQFAIKTATQQYLTNKILTTFFNKNTTTMRLLGTPSLGSDIFDATSVAKIAELQNFK